MRLVERTGRLAPRLNNRSLTFADRSLAFAPATGEAKRKNDRANDNQELFHEGTPVRRLIEKYRYFSIYN
jgi:hypothetical protein